MQMNKRMMLRKQIGIFLALCSLLFSTGGVLADDQFAVVQIGNGVVVDSVIPTVFTMHPKSGIQAIDVNSGETIWTSASADRPVAVSDKVLLAQVEAKEKGVLELAYLDAQTGQFLDELKVAIPDDARARVADGMESRFSVQMIDGTGPEHLYWKNYFKQVQGAQLTRNAAPAQRVAGFLKADYSGRTVKRVSQPAGFRPAIDRHAPLPANAPGRRALYSQDRQHIVTSSALSNEVRSRSAGGARYQWHVYTSDGDKAGSFSSAVSFAPFVVVGSTLLYVTPPREMRKGEHVVTVPMSLLAVNLNTGSEVYKVAIRDVRFRGPFPP